MKDAAQLAAVIVLLLGLGMFVLFRTARPGWESEETGFHYGEEHTDFDGDNL